MKTPYNLSKDYNQLYKLICEGLEIACFVDYTFSEGDKPVRDICKCRKLEDYWIQCIVRGTQYGGVNKWENYKGREEELFIKECERMNLEWINYLPEQSSIFPHLDLCESLPNGVLVIGCDTAHGKDISLIIEAMKKAEGDIILASGIPRHFISMGEAIYRMNEILPTLKETESLEFKSRPRLIEPTIISGKRTNHERQPSKYGKRK